MAVLYIAAESGELKFFAKHLTDVRKLSWPLDYAVQGVHRNQKIVLIANGAGPKLAAEAIKTALESAVNWEAVISTGFGGALAPALHESDIVVGQKVVTESAEQISCELLPSDAQNATFGTVLSQDRIAISAAEKQRLGQAGAIVVEMEAIAVAERARGAGLPFGCIKVVSDRADESFRFDLNRMRTREGRIARGKIVMYALMRPHLLPDLFRLQRRAAEASRALGDFLADCRFPNESGRLPRT